MPYKEHEISKMYYTMGEVAAIFDVNQSLIRFYEKEFDVLQPKKNMDESKDHQRVIDSLESIKKFLLEVREQL